MGPLLPPNPGVLPTAFAANGAAGFARIACTDTGTQVNVWCPAPGAAPNLQYFCHGHALGTFAAHGFTAFSGPDLQAVLRDEWNLVGGLQNSKQGDVVVWYGVHAGAPARLADHSALVLTVGMGSDLKVDPARTMLSSKNGTEPLTPQISLAELVRIYGAAFAVYRHR
jgi:hypothetical protein